MIPALIRPAWSMPRRGSLRRYGGRPQPLVRLVCFPWCGAGASAYRRLAPELPGHIELLAVQLPGREERLSEPKLVRMEHIIEHVFDEIAALFDRPLILFGHSMGALVAYEMALALKARTGLEPDGLIVSGHGSPDHVDPDSRHWQSAADEALIANILRMGGTAPEVLENRQLMQALLPALRTDYEVLGAYVRSPPASLSCPLLACAGDRDRMVTRDGIDAWRHYSSGRYMSHWFSGDHFYLSSRPATLTQCLREWMSPTGFFSKQSQPS